MVKLTKELIRAIIADKLTSFLDKEFSTLTEEEKFRTLNSKEANFVTKIPSATPLMVACARGDVLATKKLLELGAKVNFANNESQTALHMACLFKHFDCVKILIENGADVNKACRKEFPSLYYALQTHLDNYSYNKPPQNVQDSIEKEKNDALNIIDYLIKNSANINQSDKEGYNVYNQYLQNFGYFSLVDHTNYKALKVFLKAGLDLDIKNSKGNKFIDIVGFRGNDIKKKVMIVIDEFFIEEEKEKLNNLINQPIEKKKEKSYKI
jgi:ankyrin repeat protein